MRILEITSTYPPSVGGIQYYVQSLSQYLALRGHHVQVLTVNTDNALDKEVSPQGFSIRRSKLDHKLYRAVISSEFASQLLSAKNYDVYHIHIPFHVGLELASLAALINRIPLVVTHHGQDTRGGLLYTILANSYSIFYRVISLWNTRTFIFLTRSYGQSLWLPPFVRRRVRIVRTGADISRFSPDIDGSPIRQQYDLRATTPLVAFVGSLRAGNRYKGVDYLIRAMRLVRERLPEAKLLVVGGGELVGEFKALSQHLELQEAVIFAGSIDNQLLPTYYAAADVFVLPSISGPENSPVVVFEAMASAKPVVASCLPGLLDIVQDNQTGFLVPIKDIDKLATAIANLLIDAPLRNKMGHTARLFAETYSWDRCALEMERIFQELTLC